MTAIDQDLVRDAIERHSDASGGNGRIFHNGAYAAIADELNATLGAEDVYTREEVESAFVSGYSLGCLPVGSDPTWDQNEQTVDEHMAEWGWVRKEATTGSGTCHVKLHPDLRAYPLVRFCEGVCSECGEELPVGYNFCPNCGRRVE